MNGLPLEYCIGNIEADQPESELVVEYGRGGKLTMILRISTK